MIKIYETKKGTKFVYASDLYSNLGISAVGLFDWVKDCIDLGFKENEEYYFFRDKEGTSNAFIDCAIKFEMAKHIALLQQNRKGRALRDYLIGIDKKRSNGELLNRKQIMALIDIVQVLGYFSVQEYLERKHFDFLGKPFDWWERRAKLLGYSKKELEDGLRALRKRYKSQRQAIFLLDKFELIKIATIDLFIILGKNEEYAKNIGMLAKDLAKEFKPDICKDVGPINFKSDKELKTIAFIKSDSNLINSPLNKF